MSAKVFVVIVTYNGAKWVTPCFSSLRKSTVPLHTIVIDNGSQDDTLARIAAEYPEVEIINTGNPGLGNLPVSNATIAEFAGVMQSAVMDRPVVDKTGLTGRWDFAIRWTPDESQFGGLGVRVPPPTDDPNAPPGIFTAFTDQLGLKLDPSRAPVEVLVIDKVEKPSEN